MPTSPSTRLALVGPVGTTDLLNIGDDQIRAIITRLEAVAAGYLTPSTYASRPAAAAGNANFLHAATDTGVVGYSTGSSWIDINPKDAAAGTASLRTLGTGAAQAAPGNDARFVPVGTVLMTAAATADTGWLICDGSAVPRTGSTLALFNRIGTTHGAGDGSTTFNLPDLRGRAPIGAGTAAGAAGATAHALGAKGGEETHALTTAELAAHAHTTGAGGNGKTGTENSSLSHAHINNLPSPGRTGGTAWTAGQSGTSGANVAGTLGTISETNGVQANSPAPHDHNVTVNSTGGDAAHNNMQPYTAVNFQIKT